MLFGIDRKYVVVYAFAPVFVQDIDESVDKQRFGQLGEFRALVDDHALLFVNHVPCQIDDIDVRHAAAVKAEEKEVEAELLLLGEEATVQELHAADDVRIDRLRLELSPCHLLGCCLEDRGIGAVHIQFVFGVIDQCPEDAEQLTQTGTVAVLDAPTFQIDDVFQQELLGNVGEVVAR